MPDQYLPGAPYSSAYGYPVRRPQVSELSYFHKNPHVAGMAAADSAITLNPFSNLTDEQRAAVAKNEAARLFMQNGGMGAPPTVTEAQRAQFAGTPYEGNEDAMRQTIVARLLSQDASGGAATPEQAAYVAALAKALEARGQ